MCYTGTCEHEGWSNKLEDCTCSKPPGQTCPEGFATCDDCGEEFQLDDLNQNSLCESCHEDTEKSE
ncbi:hypothetical protein KAR91_12100 [Candidatus Pacearchaeota archaeon]|nr:hypothetical protein [Candidatus Pacearchaeota archaeon]